jgi:hypothetical protein
MRKYEKPAISVIGLQLKENIAAVPTTVYKGNASAAPQAQLVNMALSSEGTGLKANGDLVVS